MNRLLLNLPIRRKLTVVAMITTALALALACAAFALYDQLVLRRDLASDLSSTAQMIGFNSASALSFNDPDSAEQTLRSLTAHRHVLAACVYARDGAVFATYHRPGTARTAFAERPPSEGAHFGPAFLELARPIQLAGEDIGTIYLRADLDALSERLALSALIFVVVMLGAGLLAFGVVSRLQRFISDPVLQLAAVAGRVAAENNYSLRAVKHGSDEVGALIDGFNDMLAQIQSRDAALQRAQNELEKRVDERTKELSGEIAERRRTENERDRVFTLSLDFLGIVTFDGYMRRANPALQGALGLSDEEVARTQILQFIHTGDRKHTYLQLKRLIAGHPVVRFENRIRCGDGSYRWVQWSGIPFPDENCFYIYGRDVTELKQAQDAAAREKARLQFIFESVPVGISLRLSTAGGDRVRLINDAHLRICGITRQEVEDPGIFERISHPEDYARQIELNRQLEQREINGFSIEKRYLRPGGAEVWVSFSIQRHDYGDGSYEELSTVVDITALKQAQERLAQEQARLKFIFDSVPVGICLDRLRPDGSRDRILNDAHLRLCEVMREEPGVGMYHFKNDSSAHGPQIELRQQLEKGLINRFSLEQRYVRDDGQVVWIAYTVQRRRYEDGSCHDLATMVDITELKRAQEDVAAERARFKFIFESVPVGISLVHVGEHESHITNPAHERITGLNAADLARPDAFERATHPDDWERHRDIVRRYKLGEIDRFTIEKRYVRPDGTIVWAALTRRMFIDPATGRKQSITTLVDITELKRAEEAVLRERARFKFIFDVVPVGISLVAQGDGETVLVNPAHEAITGVSAAASAEPMAFERASHPDDYRRQLELAAKVQRGEIDHYSLEKRYLRPDGSIVWAVLTNRTFSDPATGRRQSVTTLVDITERKLAEAKLAETHKQLLETSRQAGMAEVATGVLHNVGNVLNSVNVSTTLLTDLVRQSKVDKIGKLAELLEGQRDLAGFFATDPRAEKVPGFVRTLSAHLTREQEGMLRELESLRKNVEHIKDIVAMQQSYAKVSGVSELVAVTELVDDALRMNGSSVAGRDIRVVRDFRAAPTILTEKHKVLQILVNLLRNARHACEEAAKGEKQMTVRVSTGGGRVRIEVADNGVGIAPENLTRIFSHGFTTRKHGHGFGLHSGAITAKELGGALSAHSDGPGHGATFTLELPLGAETKAA